MIDYSILIIQQTKIGRKTEVALTLYNVGEEAVKDVTIEDSFFSKGGPGTEMFRLVEGSTKAAFPSIAPKSEAKHVFYVEPLAVGEIKDEPAKITYSTESEVHASS